MKYKSKRPGQTVISQIRPLQTHGGGDQVCDGGTRRLDTYGEVATTSCSAKKLSPPINMELGITEDQRKGDCLKELCRGQCKGIEV